LPNELPACRYDLLMWNADTLNQDPVTMTVPMDVEGTIQQLEVGHSIPVGSLAASGYRYFWMAGHLPAQGSAPLCLQLLCG
jgi:hypothetical protein